jgi:hypothetical protein
MALLLKSEVLNRVYLMKIMARAHRRVLSRIPVPPSVLEQLDDIRDRMQWRPYSEEETRILSFVESFKGRIFYKVVRPLAEFYLAESRLYRASGE